MINKKNAGKTICDPTYGRTTDEIVYEYQIKFYIEIQLKVKHANFRAVGKRKEKSAL